MGVTALTVCALAPCLLFGKVAQVDLEAWRSRPPVDAQLGDIAFRRDDGVWSWLFINASRREKRFSHVGLVVVEGNDPRVAHADAHEMTGIGCVRVQRWSEFFSESMDGALYRYDGSAETRKRIATEAVKRAGVPFDTGFDMSNTNKLYCTELVRESVNAATECQTIGFTCLGGLRRIVAIDDCLVTNMIKVSECR